MKHLEEFKNRKTEMIPGMMYKINIPDVIDYTLGFIGINRNRIYFLTCVNFTGNINVVEIKNASVLPLNISIKDYIIQMDKSYKTNFIEKILDILKNPESSSITETSKKMSKDLYHELLENDDIQIYLQSNKYNL